MGQILGVKKAPEGGNRPGLDRWVIVTVVLKCKVQTVIILHPSGVEIKSICASRSGEP